MDWYQNDWLQSLARMAVRKKEKSLAALSPKPGQPKAEFQAFKRRMAAQLAFQKRTLRALEEEQDEL